MEIYTVKNGQNLFDLALQLYGDTSGIGDLLTQNPTLDFGYEPALGDKINYEPNNVVNNLIVQYYNNNGIVVANGVGNVYFKETSEKLKMLIFMDPTFRGFSMKISGSGTMFVDWGDNSEIEALELTSDFSDYTHYMDSFLNANHIYRKVKIYGDYTIDKISMIESGIIKIFGIDEGTVSEIDVSINEDLTNIGFLEIIKEALSVNLKNAKIEDLFPLISQERMRDLWINESNIDSDVLDSYFIGLVKDYRSRPACNVRMWQNNSPSGVYQKPDVLSDPKTGLEAMWVLENERGWTIQEIINPPNESDIVGRIRSRTGSQLIDEINGNKLDILFPTSQFQALNESAYLTTIDASTVNYISFKVFIDELPSANETVVGAKDNVSGSLFNVDILPNGHVYFNHGVNNYISETSIFDNKVHEIVIDARVAGMRCFIDGKFLYELPSVTTSVNSSIAFGCLLDSDNIKSNYFTGVMHDINVGYGQYIIPQPYLGYDTVTGVKYEVKDITVRFLDIDVKQGDLGGSEYMQLNGVVFRKPNLIPDGYAEKIGDGTVNNFWISSFHGDPNEFAGEEIELSAYLKVNQDAHDNNVTSDLKCEFLDSGNSVISEITLSSESLNYERKAITAVAPNNTYSINIKGLHNPDSITNGNSYIKEVNLTRVTPELIPNKNNGDSVFPLISGDTHIKGTTKLLNISPFRLKVRNEILVNTSNISAGFGDNDIKTTDTEVLFNKSIHNGTVDRHVSVIDDNPFIWSSEEIENMQDYLAPWAYNRVLFNEDISDSCIPSFITCKVPVFGSEVVDFLNKCNLYVWKPQPSCSIEWDVSEFNQAYVSANIIDSQNHKMWIKIEGGIYNDIFLYKNALTGDDKNRCDRYIHLNT